jgi:hypothetical protein
MATPDKNSKDKKGDNKGNSGMDKKKGDAKQSPKKSGSKK